MKKIGVLAALSTIGIVSFVSSAGAFSVVNRDVLPHLLTIFEGNDRQEVSLAPGEQADALCSSTCDVFVDDRPDSYTVAVNDALSIEDGVLLAADEPSEEPAEESAE